MKDILGVCLKRSPRYLRLILAGGLLVFLAGGRIATATDFYWANPNGGDWSNTNNWRPLVVNLPGGADTVHITLAGSYTVNGGGGVLGLELGDGVASFPTLLLNSSGVSVSGVASVGAGSRVVLKGGDGTSLFGGGTFEADGGLTLDGVIDWQAGGLGGKVTVTTNGVIAGSTALNHFYYATVFNHGRITWSANSLTSGGGWLQNEPDGALDFQNDTEFGSFGGARNPLVNNGVLFKSAGTNTLDLDGANYFTNNGTVVIQAGSLRIDNVADFRGTVVVSNGAALDLVGGTTVLEPGYAFTGPGFYGVPAGAQISLYGAVADANFRMDGALYGTNTVVGTMVCSNGNFQGATTIAASGVLNLYGCGGCGSIYSTTQTGGALTNAGVINWLSGDWTTEGGVFVNLPNGLFNIQCDDTLGRFNGLGNWFNEGAFRKTAGSGTNYLYGMIFTNTGLIEAQSGGLQFGNGATSSGTFSADPGGAILLQSGTFYVNTGSAFTGAGFYGIPADGNAYLFGLIPGTNFQVNGVLNGTNTVTGALWASGGTLSGTTIIATNATMNVNGITINGTLTNAGTIRWLSGAWNWFPSIFENMAGAVFDIQANNDMTASFGATVLHNSGTFLKSDGGGTTLGYQVSVVNDGQLRVQHGRLEFDYGLSGKGSFEVDGGASLLLQSGDCTLDPGATFTGAGFYGLTNGANITINGAISATNFQVLGTLHGTNTVVGTLWCNGGALGDSISVAPDSVLNLSSPATFSGVITNAGRVNWLAGDWAWSAGAFVNLPGGLFDIQCDGAESVLFNQPATLLNAGVLRKSGGVGTTSFDRFTSLTNTSLIDVQSGTILVQGGYGQAGGQLNFGLAGPGQYGRLNLSGPLALTGELSVNLVGGFLPAGGDTFNVLASAATSGTFPSLALPALPGNQVWKENYGATVTALIVRFGPPRLAIGISGGSFNISWSTNADSGFALQSTTNLVPPVLWFDLTNLPQTVADQNVITLPPQGNATFFRTRE